jgi:excinuclease ABC subunit C
MQQALERRYKRLANGEGQLPDILFIDGGKGQVSQARQVLATYDISSVKVVGVAKGTTRKAGFETLVDADSGAEMRLRGDHPGLHLIQQIRDEAHRFAISGHRGQRAKARKQSLLEDIPVSEPSVAVSYSVILVAQRPSKTPALRNSPKLKASVTPLHERSTIICTR